MSRIKQLNSIVGFLQNERIVIELYNMPWHRLSVLCQKDVCIAMHMGQIRAVFTIAPLVELNFETATDVSFIQIILDN